MLSLNMLDNSDFFSGAFAAEYGNALSGVMDIKLRKGNNQKSEMAFQAGFIGLDLAAEGPFKKGKKSSYLVNYRYSTLGLLQNFTSISNGQVPQYQDISFNLTFPKETSTTNVWGIAGNGVINDQNDLGNTKIHIESANVIGGLTHRRNFNNRTSLHLALSGSVSTDGYTKSVVVSQQTTEVSDSRHNESQSLRVYAQFNKKFSARSALRSGLVFSYQNYKLSRAFIDYSNNKLQEFPLDANGATGYAQAYGQWKKSVGNRITLNTGLHGIFFLLNEHYSIEPRLGLNYEISSSANIAFASGLHSRIQPLNLYFDKTQDIDGTPSGSNRNLDFSKAIHYVVSYDKIIGESFHVRAEAYYQYLYGIPVCYTDNAPVKYTSYSALNLVTDYVGASLQESTPFPLANTGNGKNYGIEFTFEKFFSKNYYFLLTTSLYQSSYQGSDHIERNTQFNGQHIFTAAAGKEYHVGIGKNNIVELNARVTWAGNIRYIPIDVKATQATNYLVYDYARSYEEQLPDYFRLDLHFGFRRNKRKVSHIWSFDLRNATNRMNAGYGQDISFRNGVPYLYYNQQLGLIPVLNYRIEF
jgi:hypothetical protein